MSALKLSDPMAERIADLVQAESQSLPYHLHLFENNHTPANSDTVAAYTECTFPGYASVDLPAIVGVSIAAHIATATWAPEVFTRSAGGGTFNIYGYYVTDDTDAVLLWAQRDDLAPVTMNTVGQTYVVVPIMTFQDLTPA